MIDFEFLSHLSQSTSITDVLDYYQIDYQQSGSIRAKAICPFHDDSNPSLSIYIDTNSFYCFVDHNGGDVFQFIKLMEKDNFNAAWAVLCEINHIDHNMNSELELSKELREKLAQGRTKKRNLGSINYQISIMYRDLLRNNKTDNDFSNIVDYRFKLMDDYLTTDPTFDEFHEYYKQELLFYSELLSKYNIDI